MSNPKPISIDGSGFDVLKDAVMSLLNLYPGLNGRTITYMGLHEDSGISMEPESGALVYSETKDIIGNVSQVCQFPFFVVYRSGASNEKQKLSISEFLDSLGSWIAKEPENTGYTLPDYPDMTGNRKISSIIRFNSYALAPNQNNTQDWVLPVTVNYTHEFVSW